MAKGQMKSNKEVKKPKKNKDAPAPASAAKSNVFAPAGKKK